MPGEVPGEVPSETSVGAPAAASPRDLVDIRGLDVQFGGGRSRFRRSRVPVVDAVDGVGLTLGHGEIVGLVGESGSGKTTLGKALLRLAPITSGHVTFEGTDLATISRRDWQPMRRRLQMIFQEPYGSLSPRMRVQELITEPYAINRIPAAQQYSADEPTSGLDVSAAAAVLNLLRDLRAELSLTLLVITHDLNIVGYVADRVAVMQGGTIVEIGPAHEVIDTPRHPYTQQLLASAPELPETRWPS